MSKCKIKKNILFRLFNFKFKSFGPQNINNNNKNSWC